MNRLDHDNQRRDNRLFAIVLAAAAICSAGIVAAPSAPSASSTATELERVVVVGQRQAATAPVELPRVVITGQRLGGPEVARAASRDRNG